MAKIRDNVVKRKSFAFAVGIVLLCKKLVKEEKEFVLSRQLLRSGTAVGAMVRESEHAESKRDFIHKMAIALKEANETEYWLDLLFEAKYISKVEYEEGSTKIKELLKLLVSIIKTSKQR